MRETGRTGAIDDAVVDAADRWPSPGETGPVRPGIDADGGPLRLRDAIHPRSLPGLAREAVATGVTLAAWPFGVVDRGLAHAAASIRHQAPLVDAPVLLVHGYAANKSNWLFVQRALRAAGFAVHAVNCNPFRDDIPTQAAAVRDRARALMAAAGSDRVHLVGHSMGGLLARWAVQVGGLHEARTVVTVASPHGGSHLARLGVGRTAAQMRPGSDVVRRLAEAPAPPDTRFVAYWSELDAVVPPQRARILCPRLDATNVHVPGEGHLSIMLSRDLADSVVTQLAAAEGRPGWGSPLGSLDHARVEAAQVPAPAEGDRGSVAAVSQP